MPTAKEIIGDVRRRRGSYYRKFDNGITGKCTTVGHTVHKYLEGVRGLAGVWVSDMDDPTLTRISHYVGVLRTRGNAGIAFQFSGSDRKDRRIALANIPNVHDRPGIIQALNAATGLTGWRRKTKVKGR